MKTVIVNVNLEYAFDVATDEEAEIEVQNIERAVKNTLKR